MSDEIALTIMREFRKTDRITNAFRQISSEAVDTNMELMDVCMKALEKQIPKKPIYSYSFGDVTIKGEWCPTCEWGIHKKYDSVDGNYCPNCGQRIKSDD